MHSLRTISLAGYPMHKINFLIWSFKIYINVKKEWIFAQKCFLPEVKVSFDWQGEPCFLKMYFSLEGDTFKELLKGDLFNFSLICRVAKLLMYLQRNCIGEYDNCIVESHFRALAILKMFCNRWTQNQNSPCIGLRTISKISNALNSKIAHHFCVRTQQLICFKKILAYSNSQLYKFQFDIGCGVSVM